MNISMKYDKNMPLFGIKGEENMNGIKTAITFVAGAAYSSLWWSVAMFGWFYGTVVPIGVLLVAFTTFCLLAVSANWTVNHWDD